MPNRCEGILKLRGNKDNLVKFLADCFELEIDYNDYEIFKGVKGYFYSKDSCMFTTKNIWWDFNEPLTSREERTYIKIIDIQQARNIRTDYFFEIAKKYDLDIKVEAFEMGMQFSRKIEIIDKEVIVDEIKIYKDYKWEVYDPRLGG